MTTSFNTYDYFFSLVDHEKGISERKAAMMAIEAGMPAWGDPRFTKSVGRILNKLFLSTAKWLRGKQIAQLVLDNAEFCIDPDLVEISKSLLNGEVPENPAWNHWKKSYSCPWPASLTRYANPWNGNMFRWALEIEASDRMSWRLRSKARRGEPQRKLG